MSRADSKRGLLALKDGMLFFSIIINSYSYTHGKRHTGEIYILVIKDQKKKQECCYSIFLMYMMIMSKGYKPAPTGCAHRDLHFVLPGKTGTKGLLCLKHRCITSLNPPTGKVYVGFRVFIPDWGLFCLQGWVFPVVSHHPGAWCELGGCVSLPGWVICPWGVVGGGNQTTFWSK